MSPAPRAPAAPLAGVRVLVPRAGELGSRLATLVRERGGTPYVEPLIDFRPPADADAEALDAALARLAAGRYDWLVLTSATTVEALVDRGATLPSRTAVAVVGPRTAAAADAAGWRVALVPPEHSATGLVAAWPTGSARPRVLLPQSELAESTLADGLRALDARVDTVVAYGVVRATASPDLRRLVESGGPEAVLLTSGSAARAAAAVPGLATGRALVACLGPRTAEAAAAAGLRVAAVAAQRSAESLVDALVEAFGEPAAAPDRA